MGFHRKLILLARNCGPCNFRTIPRNKKTVARNSDWKPVFSAYDPFNFDADPDPGSALKKMDPAPSHFFKITVFF